ncbi:ATP-dependent RNA helicase supv3l1, mitochondrial [Desmophyllum pertusum]|uniref:RNA helicase n=1 Tax=Desmophyllum pertusum TaxID=174260 RepID=A0A9X0D3K0_9CNID|nr:ATP-dependent RNA helicase supv3l1, mitochondrial [Desmophyllum pertusum]
MKLSQQYKARSLLQKESVTQRSDEQDNHTTLQDRGDTSKESSVNEDVTKQYCQNTEEKTKVDTNESLTNNLIICSVGRPSLNDTKTSFRKTSSKDDSSSQTSVPITTEMANKFLLSFAKDKQVRKAAQENGLTGTLFTKIFQEFRRKLLLQMIKGNKEMLKVFSTSYFNSGNVAQLFPLFLAFARDAHPMLNCIDEVKKISRHAFPEARAIKRKIIFHAGPTNSGKTHAAIEKFRAADTGVYCGPLRLLATEVFRRTNDAGVHCDLMTGEDRQWAISSVEPANHIASTIEMCSTRRPYDCAVIDEIQMIKDSDRGWAWSRALLGLPCPEIHLCGESSAINVVQRLVSSCDDEMEVHHYERLSPLRISHYSLGGSFKNVKPGDCVVAFSQQDLYRVRREIERASEQKCAIIYGSLPPATKVDQANKFNDPSDECSVLVASDAIGMGLNLNIKRIVFSTLMKFNGTRIARLTSSQAKQIAGRAGRFGSAHPEGEAITFSKQDSKVLRSLMNETIEDVEAAGLAPSMEQIEMLSEQLPDASILKLYEVFESVVQLDGANYFMCDLEEQKIIAKKIRGIALSIRDQYVFSTAPISVKKILTIELAVQFAEYVSRDSAVTSLKLKALIKWPPGEPRTLTQLKDLEALHEGLDLYLWLSYRFPHIFVDQEDVCEMQDGLEAIIGKAVSSNTLQTQLKRFGEEKLDKWLKHRSRSFGKKGVNVEIIKGKRLLED